MVRLGWGSHPSLLNKMVVDNHRGRGPCPKDACRDLYCQPSQAMEHGASFKISNEEGRFCSNSLKIEIAR
jgi:hypothetical protein